jgi:hypothetical protein
MVAGALGVAIVGSLVDSLYRHDIAGSLAALPPQARAAAEGSVGAAHAIATHLPPGPRAALLGAAGSSFTQAMGIGLAVAAALAALSAVIVARLLPAGDERTEAPASALQDARAPAG